ncbi:MAG TPA: NfeD family protein [Thermotogota bacterium]|nr:NfeD family protein [Thermotogota bacterium]HRW33815.1 NfeD family protein [Thermotogota bacterium]
MSWEIVWMILGFVLLIAEMFTATFFIMWFGVSALITALFSWLWVSSVTIQLLIFAICSFLLVLFTKKLTNKFSGEPSRKITQDEIIGKIGLVTETILSDNSKGIVKIDGQEWRACSISGVVIEKGKEVVIKRLQGVKLYVQEGDAKN